MRVVLFAALLAVLCVSAFAGDKGYYSRLYDKYAIKPVELGSVEIEGDLKRQLDEVMWYYLLISSDDILKDYRERAGLKAPGNPMGGGYIGHSPFGQFLSGYARLYAYSGDELYKKKALYLMNEWAKTIEEDGFCFASRDPFITPYYCDKLACGLLDIYTYCGEKRALPLIRRVTEWAEKNLDRGCRYADTTGVGTGEWYTISDNFNRVYMATGDEYYRSFAKLWEYTEFWDEILAGDLEAMYKKSRWHHAYSHVNSFNGLASGYLVTGDKKYLDTLKAAYDFMQKEQCFATGGFGQSENLGPRNEVVNALGTVSASFETECGSWAGFKLSKYLTGITGDAEYADWTERLIINGTSAAIPQSGRGSAFYYSEYRTGGACKRHFWDDYWSCCTGTRIQCVSEYPNLIYFTDDKGIYISQFFANRARLRAAGKEIGVSTETRFPEEDSVRIRLDMKEPCRFALRFRLPGWLAAPAAVSINGKRAEYSETNNWGIVERLWKDGDRIELILPMKIRAEHMYNDKANPYALVYGPTVLAFRSINGLGNPARAFNPEDAAAEFIRKPSEKATWVSKINADLILKPFYAFKESERYFVYLDPAREPSWLSGTAAAAFGSCYINGDLMVAPGAGDILEYVYHGDSVTISGKSFDDCGIADVLIDGIKVGEHDMYTAERGKAFSKSYRAGSYGKHILRLENTGRKQPESRGTFINVTGVEAD